MATFVSMLTWSGDPQPEPCDVRTAVDARSFDLQAQGMHSLVFLPDRGVCAAVMVSSHPSDAEISGIAASILPDADVRVTSLRFDDDPTLPASIAGDVLPPSPDDQLVAMFQAATGA